MSEVEMRYYLLQMLSGMEYLHAQNVIHRDLKLGNLFLTGNMEIKIGDFGLATRVDFKDQRRTTMCGTPNYIAPEILMGKCGHSFEVDIWSIGVVIYTMLVGKPPYETTDIKSTYQRIKANVYHFPEHIDLSENAQDLIRRILQTRPSHRLTIAQIRQHPFMDGTIVATLPSSSIYTPPKETIKGLQSSSRQPLRNTTNVLTELTTKTPKKGTLVKSTNAVYSPGNAIMETMQNMLNTYLAVDRAAGIVTDFAALSVTTPTPPPLWIVQWVDYTTKYGMGYLLNTGQAGVYFNDATKIICTSSSKKFHYIERSSSRTPGALQWSVHGLLDYDEKLKKKVTLLEHFNSYLQAQSEKSSSLSDPLAICLKSHPSSSHLSSRQNSNEHLMIYVRKWIKTRHAVLFCLTNESVQVNFYDLTRIMISQGGQQVTYVDKNGILSQWTLNQLMKMERNDVMKRLKYSRDILSQMLGARKSTTTASVSPQV